MSVSMSNKVNESRIKKYALSTERYQNVYNEHRVYEFGSKKIILLRRLYTASCRVKINRFDKLIGFDYINRKNNHFFIHPNTMCLTVTTVTTRWQSRIFFNFPVGHVFVRSNKWLLSRNQNKQPRESIDFNTTRRIYERHDAV